MEKPIWVACGTDLGHYGQHIKVIWSLMRENSGGGGGGGGEQERCRPACASALSDQPLCCSLFVKYQSLNDYM